ncbi:MAG: hypothetical protein ACFFD1_00855 [Candidatus Thorarchaeota archaeon]
MVFKKKNKDDIPEIVPASPQSNQQQYPKQLPPLQQVPRQQMQQPAEFPWALQEVATETSMVIVNQQTGETIDLMSAIVKILNILEQ